MELPASSTATHAAKVLEALNPLLVSQDAGVVGSVVATIRETNPPPTVLATSLYAFSKLVLTIPDSAAPFREVVGSLVSTTLLPRDVLYEAIDVETHQLFEPTIARAAEEKRTRTRLWFTQTRFNLFREESEGYSKVVALMWDTVVAPDSVEHNAVKESMLALIGQFSLDTNRVIELVLSAAADVITEQRSRAGNIPFDHRLPPLFVKLLDEFPRDHVCSVVGAMLQSYHPVNVLAAGVSLDPGANKQASQTSTGTGESEKTNSETKSSAPKTPEALYYLIGILMREGRMRIVDVWHNLYPRDDRELARKFLAYEEQLEALSKHVASTSVARPPNAQTPAIFVRNGTSASERDVFSLYKWVTAGPFAQYACQKLHFIFVLIIMCRVDDVWDAIRSLGVDGEHIDIAAHPVIAQALAAFAEALLNPLLNNKFPGFYRDNSHISKAIAQLGGRANRCPCTVATVNELLDENDDGAGAVILRILQVLGPHARTAPCLLQALCKLLRGRSEERAVALMQDVILPAASLLQSNVGLTSDIWDVLRNWPHTIRWSIYGNLQNVVAESSAAYQLAARRASYEMRYVLKRLTKETQKQHVTTIGKLTRGQALPAFSAAIDRIQGYPPDVVTISPVIDACQDCSNLAVDMLLFLIIDRMADSRRRRLKEDGINIAQWYATLSLFLGLCLRKLPVNSQQIEGVLSFLFKKLVVDQEALLITALSDIIKCVADIEIESNLTAKQIEAQGGGKYLRSAVSGMWGRLQPDIKMVGHAFDPKVEREKRGAVIALLTAFKRTKMHVPISIAIAQMSRDAACQEELRTMPLKLGANILDRARSSLLQLSTFMDSFRLASGWEKQLHADIWRPLQEVGLARLVSEMGVLTPFAITLLAPVVHYRASSPKGGNLANSTSNEGSKERTPKDASVSSEANETKRTSNGAGQGASGSAKNFEKGTANEQADPMEVDKPASAHRATNGNDTVSGKPRDESVTMFAEILANKSHGMIATEFVRAFWTLKLDDIAVPAARYETEKKRLTAARETWEREVERNRRHNNHVDGERRRRCESELRRIREFVESLETEKAAFTQKQMSTLVSLKASRDQLCCSHAAKTQADKEGAVCFLLQECILPRSRLSISDAIFCSKFMLLMLELDIPVICFSAYFEGVLKLTPLLLTSCSENEALSFSRLLKEVLTTLEKWRSNRKVFDSEAAGGKKFGLRDAEKPDTNPLRHEQYCQWLFELHEQLTDGLCRVLISDEYLYTRNALYVLAGIADVFPKVAEHSVKIEEGVAKMCESELPDIRLSSTGVLARLKSGHAKRLPRHIFKLKPSSGALSAGGQGKRKAPTQEGSKPKQLTAGNEPKSSSTPAPEAKREQELRLSGAAASLNGVPSSTVSEKSKETAAQKPILDPTAKEFVPASDSSRDEKSSAAKPSGTATIGVKRERDTDDAAGRVSSSQPGSSDARKLLEPSGSEPPAKRPRAGDVRQDGETGKQAAVATSADNKPPSRESAGRVGSVQSVHSKKVPTTSKIGSPKVSGLKPPSGDGPGRDGPGRENVTRGSTGAPARNGASRDTRQATSQATAGRDASGRSPPRREGSGRSPSTREAPGRSPSGRDQSGRSPPGREAPGRSTQGRDGGGRSSPHGEAPPRSTVGRESQARPSGGRERPSRESSGRDGGHREGGARGGARRESPGQGTQRKATRGEPASREANGVSGKDLSRRRRGADGQSGQQFGAQGDTRIAGRDSQDYDDSLREGHGMKRRREGNMQRDSYPFDGENRRSTRQRTEGSYRDRPPSREPPNMRFNGPPSPAREPGRSFPGQGPPVKPGWGEHARSRSHEALHEMRGGGGGGPRRRDHEADPGAGWKPRPGERLMEFDGRDRPPGRGREGPRDGDFGGYDERGPPRGGDRYADRRNGGREERGPRDRGFARKAHPRPVGRRRG